MGTYSTACGVTIDVGVCVGVDAGISVAVAVGVLVGVGVGILVCVVVAVGVLVGVGVPVGVAGTPTSAMSRDPQGHHAQPGKKLPQASFKCCSTC